MKDCSIRYRHHPNWKYQLIGDRTCIAPFQPNIAVDTKYVSLGIDGTLTVRDGYSWDGPSGPTIDTKNFLRGSLFHDAVYQLMRLGLLPRDEASRERADALLRAHCLEDGMSRVRAWWVYHGLRIGGGRATLARMDNKYKEELVAP